jgi:hypothetical protein
METVNNILDLVFYKGIQPLILFIKDLLDIVFLRSLSLLSVPYWAQVVFIAICLVLLAFGLRKWLNVERKEKIFRKKFVAQKTKRDTITIIPDKRNRDALLSSADQSIDEDFNTYLAQHYFRYVLVYLLPIFLVMSWLNNSLDDRILPVVSGQTYLFLLPSHPLGMQGISVTFLFLSSYIFFLIAGFQLKKQFFRKGK